MMGVRLLRVLPGLPFLPGHKAVLLLPLYLFGAARGSGRFTATAVGLIVGLLSLMQGDGRYGALEVLKHVAPGLLADLLWPLARRAPGPLLLRATLLGLTLALEPEVWPTDRVARASATDRCDRFLHGGCRTRSDHRAGLSGADRRRSDTRRSAPAERAHHATGGGRYRRSDPRCAPAGRNQA
jgi:hypothetical protein